MDAGKLTENKINILNQKLDNLEGSIKEAEDMISTVEKEIDEIEKIKEEVVKNSMDATTLFALRFGDDAFKYVEHVYYNKLNKKSYGSKVLEKAINKFR